ncbi:MAG: CHAT domain-containing protein [Acidobacteriota bacterium]|nr:CHAT domain-containing protein [Acidobacteriota bacterium]
MVTLELFPVPTGPGCCEVVVSGKNVGEASGILDLRDWNAEAPEDEQGRVLFKKIFNGDIADLFSRAPRPLRLRIFPGGESDAAGAEAVSLVKRLHDLPWEAMAGRTCLGLDADFSVVRAVKGGVPLEVVPVVRIRVLVVAVQTNDTEALDLKKELDIIGQAKGRLLKVDFLEGADPETLRSSLENGYQVVHFMGHGGLDAETDEPVLFFKDEFGDALPVSGAYLAAELRALEKSRRPALFVLNACHGGNAQVDVNGMKGVAASLIREGIPAVSAMRRPISDYAAVAFAKGFYDSLAAGNTMDHAVIAGRRSVQREELEDEVFTPCLYSKHAGGHVSKPVRKRPIYAAIAVALLLIPALWFFRSREPVRVHFEEVRIDAGTSDRDLWEEALLPAATLPAFGIMATEHDPDYSVELALNRNDALKLAVTIRDRSGKLIPVPEISIPEAGDDTARLEDARFQLMSLLSRKLARERRWIEPVYRTRPRALHAFHRGNKAWREGNLKEAGKHYREARDQDSRFAPAFSNLAMVFLAQGRPKSALEDALSAVDLIPENPGFHYNLGRVYIALKENGQALDAFKKAIDLDPGHVDALHEAGKILLAEGRFDRASRQFHEVLRYDKHHPGALKNLGRAHLKSNQPELADAYLKQALARYIQLADPLGEAETLALTALTAHKSGDAVAVDGAMTRYEAIVGSLPMPWSEEVAALRTGKQRQQKSALSGSASPSLEIGNSLFAALVLNVSGRVEVKTRHDRMIAEPRMLLNEEHRLELPAETSITLLDHRNRLHTLKGPVSRRIEPLLFDQVTPMAGALFSRLAPLLKRRRFAGFAQLSPASRGDELSEPGSFTFSKRPTTAWLGNPENTTVKLEWVRPRPGRTMEVQANREHQGNPDLLRVGWPEEWPDAPQGDLTLRVVQNVNGVEQSWQSTFRVMYPDEQIQTQLDLIDQLPTSMQTRLRADLAYVCGLGTR